MPTVCRDCCDASAAESACSACGSRRVVSHPELDALSVAHLDCDSFYASVEKRDNPELTDKPVLVGGQRRGVVMAACYVARRYGVHSAMPMFKALRACPDAVVIKPDMAKYRRVGLQIRAMMRDTTPLVEPISIDEAFMDLGGTERLHGGSAARTLLRLAAGIGERHGIAVSIGLSCNKFLAKLASGLDKPRGFRVIGREEAATVLRDLPVSRVWGVGEAMQRRLARDGVASIGQLQEFPAEDLRRRYGKLGLRLAQLSRGLDERRVEPGSERKSLSSETTFASDISDAAELKRVLWRLSEKVSAGLKKERIGGRTVTLKLKTADFRIGTRSRTLAEPTQLAGAIYEAGAALLDREADGRRFRLIGIGLSGFEPADVCDLPDLADPDAGRRKRVEDAVDSIRERFGADVIGRGRAFDAETRRREGTARSAART